jgi:hypothetical protein
MKTEIKPRIKSGFFLNEIELIRIKDAQNEQIKKINNNVDAEFNFEVKYKNGAISNPSSISDILNEENDGSKSIIRLKMEARQQIQNGAEVHIQFSDVSHQENSDEVPISYLIQSNDKDWTFVSASTIEERISKVKSGKIAEFFSLDKLLPAAMAAFTLAMMAFLMFYGNMASVDQRRAIDDIYSHSKNSNEFIYKLEIWRITRSAGIESFPTVMFLLYYFYLLLWP